MNEPNQKLTFLPRSLSKLQRTLLPLKRQLRMSAPLRLSRRGRQDNVSVRVFASWPNCDQHQSSSPRASTYFIPCQIFQPKSCIFLLSQLLSTKANRCAQLLHAPALSLTVPLSVTAERSCPVTSTAKWSGNNSLSSAARLIVL